MKNVATSNKSTTLYLKQISASFFVYPPFMGYGNQLFQEDLRFFNWRLDIWHIASGQNWTQPGGLLLGRFSLGTAT